MQHSVGGERREKKAMADWVKCTTKNGGKVYINMDNVFALYLTATGGTKVIATADTANAIEIQEKPETIVNRP
jgi:hypothetical protein